MQSFARLMSAHPAPAAPASGSSTATGSVPRYIRNVGNFPDGRGNQDVKAKELAFSKGYFQRYLNAVFPKKFQVAGGVATLVTLGVGLFFVISPPKNAGAPDNITRTKEWEKATVEYMNKQTPSPAHKTK